MTWQPDCPELDLESMLVSKHDLHIIEYIHLTQSAIDTVILWIWAPLSLIGWQLIFQMTLRIQLCKLSLVYLDRQSFESIL